MDTPRVTSTGIDFNLSRFPKEVTAVVAFIPEKLADRFEPAVQQMISLGLSEVRFSYDFVLVLLDSERKEIDALTFMDSVSHCALAISTRAAPETIGDDYDKVDVNIHIIFKNTEDYIVAHFGQFGVFLSDIQIQLPDTC